MGGSGAETDPNSKDPVVASPAVSVAVNSTSVAMVWLISVAVTVTGEVIPTEKEETATTALLAKSTTIFSMRAVRCWILA